MRPEFSIRSDSVDVEQIMKQIRSRVREKRGVDYTEEEIRELAKVKLEQFLDPARLRSDLLTHYRARRPGPVPPAGPVEMPPVIDLVPPPDVPPEPEPENFDFAPTTPYESSRGIAGRLLFYVRRALNPLLKLFINPNPILHVITMQSAFNARTTSRFNQLVDHANRANVRFGEVVEHLKVLNTQGLVPLRDGLQEGVQEGSHHENSRRNIDALNYEVAHNLVLEMTRLGIEVKNMKMRVESIASRLDFTDRRLRALEGVVQYKPGTGPAAELPKPSPPLQSPAQAQTLAPGRPPVSRPPAQVQQPRPAAEPQAQPDTPAKGEAQRARRRRRRRGRGGSAQGPGTAEGGSGDTADTPGPEGADSPDAGRDAGSDAGSDPKADRPRDLFEMSETNGDAPSRNGAALPSSVPADGVPPVPGAVRPASVDSDSSS